MGSRLEGSLGLVLRLWRNLDRNQKSDVGDQVTWRWEVASQQKLDVGDQVTWRWVYNFRGVLFFVVNLIFTSHSYRRMFERGIGKEMVWECVEFPDYRISRGDKVEMFKKFGNRTLRVVCIQKSKFIKVVTLVWK